MESQGHNGLGEYDTHRALYKTWSPWITHFHTPDMKTLKHTSALELGGQLTSPFPAGLHLLFFRLSYGFSLLSLFLLPLLTSFFFSLISTHYYSNYLISSYFFYVFLPISSLKSLFFPFSSHSSFLHYPPLPVGHQYLQVSFSLLPTISHINLPDYMSLTLSTP